MKKMIPFILLTFLSLNVSAQDSTFTTTTVDSVTTVDSAQVPYTAPVITGDTMLQADQLVIPGDSVSVMSNSKDLVYLKDLDSLLRDAQQQEIAEQKKQVKQNNNEGDSWLTRFFLSKITKYFFWVLGGAFILFILYRLFLSDGMFERRSASVKNEDEKPEAVHHSVAGYYPLIDRAIANKNYRAAVRYLFLQTLQQLSDDKQIVLAPQKTNYQYLFELKDRELRNRFASLTLHYEYVWYGRFDLDEMTFDNIRNNFKNFMDQL
jgi:hypothetical protein